MHKLLYSMPFSPHNSLIVYTLVLFCSCNIVAMSPSTRQGLARVPIVPAQWVATATKPSVTYQLLIGYIEDNNLLDFITLLMQEHDNLVHWERSGEEKKLFLYAVQQGNRAFVTYLLLSPTIGDNILLLRQALRIACNHKQWENALVILIHCCKQFKGKQFITTEIAPLIPPIIRLIALTEEKKSAA